MIRNGTIWPTLCLWVFSLLSKQLMFIFYIVQLVGKLSHGESSPVAFKRIKKFKIIGMNKIVVKKVPNFPIFTYI